MPLWILTSLTVYINYGSYMYIYEVVQWYNTNSTNIDGIDDFIIVIIIIHEFHQFQISLLLIIIYIYVYIYVYTLYIYILL